MTWKRSDIILVVFTIISIMCILWLVGIVLGLLVLGFGIIFIIGFPRLLNAIDNIGKKKEAAEMSKSKHPEGYPNPTDSEIKSFMKREIALMEKAGIRDNTLPYNKSWNMRIHHIDSSLDSFWTHDLIPILGGIPDHLKTYICIRDAECPYGNALIQRTGKLWGACITETHGSACKYLKVKPD